MSQVKLLRFVLNVYLLRKERTNLSTNNTFTTKASTAMQHHYSQPKPQTPPLLSYSQNCFHIKPIILNDIFGAKSFDHLVILPTSSTQFDVMTKFLTTKFQLTESPNSLCAIRINQLPVYLA
jgi:hypothetical protein